MHAKVTSYGVITVDVDGELPILPNLAKTFGVRAGDFVGLRSFPGDRFELSFWRQLRPKVCRSHKRTLPPEQMIEVKCVHVYRVRRKASR